MTPKCERPAGWQAGQGAMSAACSGDSVAKGSSTCEQHKAVIDDTELARRVLAMPAVLDDDPQIAAAQRQARARAAAYLARQRLASHNDRAPRATARPVARVREHRTASPAVRPVRAAAAVAVLDDDGGDGAGGDDGDEDAAPGWLACSHVGVPGAKGNYLDRMTIAVVGYLQGRRADRFVSSNEALGRWPWPTTKPTPKALRDSFRRLASGDEFAVLRARDGGYRVNAEVANAARMRGARFRFLSKDFNTTLSLPAVHVLALRRGRAAGCSTPWADSASFLAKLLGANERTVRRADEELLATGRLHLIAHRQLGRGSPLPVYLVVDSVENGAATCPIDESLAQVEEPLTRHSEPLARQSGTEGSTNLRLDHPRALALVESPKVGPAAPDQSRASGADDPEQNPEQTQNRRLPPPSAAAKPVPSWLRIEAIEPRGRAGLESWDAYRENLRAAVAVAHGLDTDDRRAKAQAMFDVLTLLGVLMLAKASEAGHRGIRVQRRDLADALAAAGHSTITICEWCASMRTKVKNEGRLPRQVAAALRVALTEKTTEFRERATGNPLPLGVEPLQFVTDLHKVGRNAYPRSWWFDALSPEDQERRIAADKVLALAAEMVRAPTTQPVDLPVLREQERRAHAFAALRSLASTSPVEFVQGYHRARASGLDDDAISSAAGITTTVLNTRLSNTRQMASRRKLA